MDYEKKYKDAVSKIKSIIADKKKQGLTNCLFKGDLNEIFPELKESEDERIRKAIHVYLDWLDGRKDIEPRGEYSIRDMIAWLKKQCEQNSSDSYCQENCKGFQETGKCYADGECKAKREAEQNYAWSEEDKRILNSIIEDVMPCGECPDYPTDEEREYFYEGNKKADWLKSIKDRVGCEVNCTTTKQWSEEDELMLKDTITAIDMILTSTFQENNPNLYKSFEVAKHWLKSLKPQPHWKPTEEQIK